MFRRAKLWLTAVPPEVLRDASVRPPVIEWSAAPALTEPGLTGTA
jgi:hypothetical protein